MADYTTMAYPVLGFSGASSIGATRTSTCRGVSGKKTRRKKTAYDRRYESSSYKGSSSKGRGRTKDKVGDGKTSKGSKHRQDYKIWGKARRPESRDRVPRRSAQELGIKYPSAKCSNSNHHYWIGVTSEIYRCKFCREVKWMPVGFGALEVLVSRSHNIGKEAAYLEAINSQPGVLDAICVLLAIDQLADSHQQVFDLANDSPNTQEVDCV